METPPPEFAEFRKNRIKECAYRIEKIRFDIENLGTHIQNAEFHAKNIDAYCQNAWGRGANPKERTAAKLNIVLVGLRRSYYESRINDLLDTMMMDWSWLGRYGYA